MSTQLLNCPYCKKMLRSDRPVPTGATLRCPECKTGFSAPAAKVEPELDLTPQTPRLIGPAFFIAIAVSLILGGTVITTAILLSGGRKPDEPKKDDTAAKLAEEQKKQAERQKEIDAAREKLDLSTLLVEGKTALAAGRYDDAEKAFGKARVIAPTDLAVIEGLASARAARETTKKADDEAKKRDGEREKLLAEARKLMGEKQYARAIPVLEAAKTLAPADGAVISALAEARTALDADDAEKKKLADYNKFVAAGKTALEAGKLTDALRELAAALAIVPGAKEAKDLQKVAERKLAEKEKVEKKNKAFEGLLTKGRAAMNAKRYNDAVVNVEAAMRLIPDDREGKRLLQSIKDAREKAKTANGKLVAQANAAASAGNLEEAVRLATEATNNWMEDENAKKALRNAQRLLDTVNANQNAYVRYMQAGALAMTTGAYVDAVNAYAQAQLLAPTNLEVARLLRNARIEAAVVLRARVEYERLLKVGVVALTAQRFTDAITAFRAAGKLLPGDLAWQDGLSKAKYGRAMLAGLQALKLGQKKQAIAAYETALTERVGDPSAQRGLELARRLR